MKPESSSAERHDRRQELTLAAFHAIAEKGFEGLRVRDVAAQVGINGATLHHYFSTKEDLIRGVVEYTINRLRGIMITYPEANMAPREQLRHHVARLYDLMQGEPELFVVLTEVSLRARRMPVLGFLVEQNRVWHDMVMSMIVRGIAEGSWPAEIDADGAAWALITLMEGLSSWATAAKDRADKVMSQLDRWLASNRTDDASGS